MVLTGEHPTKKQPRRKDVLRSCAQLAASHTKRTRLVSNYMRDLVRTQHKRIVDADWLGKQVQLFLPDVNYPDGQRCNGVRAPNHMCIPIGNIQCSDSHSHTLTFIIIEHVNLFFTLKTDTLQSPFYEQCNI